MLIRVFRLTLWTMASCSLAMPACQPIPGVPGGGLNNNGSNGINIDEPVRPAADVGEFIAADEPWAVGAPTLLAFGVGDFLDFVLVTAEPTNAVTCMAPTPAATVEFRDGTLTLTSLPLTDPNGIRCSLNLSMNAADCTPYAGMSGPPNPCFLSSAAGEVVLNGTPLSVEDPQIVRFDRCEGASSLAGVGDWTALSVHPFGLAFLDDPSGFGAVMTVTGSGNSLGLASVVTSADAHGEPVGCLVAAPTGVVNLQNDELSIDLMLDEQSNTGGTGTPDTCTIRFTGMLTFCEILDPSALGGSGQAVQLQRFDGIGHFESPDGDGTFKTIYFGFQPPGGP